MKKALILLTATMAFSMAAFAYNYDSTVPVAGESLADGKTQTEMLFPIYAYALRVATPECQEFSISNTEVTVPKQDGNWEEIWTVKACERTARIPIKFTSNAEGFDFAIDPMGVKVAK